jgi:hypothetical protein
MPDTGRLCSLKAACELLCTLDALPVHEMLCVAVKHLVSANLLSADAVLFSTCTISCYCCMLLTAVGASVSSSVAVASGAAFFFATTATVGTGVGSAVVGSACTRVSAIDGSSGMSETVRTSTATAAMHVLRRYYHSNC